MKFLLLLFLCANSFLFAQEITIHQVINQFQENHITTPQEKNFLHTDSEVYRIGDTLWYAAYLVNASTNKSNDLSNVLYVELINAQAEIILRQKIKLENGRGNGDFNIPDSLKNGTYQLRAYTNWMLNFNEVYLFKKTIFIVSPYTSSLPTTTAIPNLEPLALAVQFFPEGGQFIAGINAKIGFKATDSKGIGVPIRGILLNSKGEDLLHFSSLKFGMGQFTFKPDFGEQYKARIILADNSERTVVLPTVQEIGYVMQINHLNSDFVTINIKTNITAAAQPSFYIIGQTNGIIHFVGKGASKNGIFSSKIPKEKFGQGITQFTLIDTKGIPQCERIVYLNQPEIIKPSINFSVQTLGKKKKMTIELGELAGSVPSSFSISVSHQDIKDILSPNSPSLATYLFLTSELKGYIEQPEYYFKTQSFERSQALDNLLLTQGWRRFKWNHIIENKSIEHPRKIEKGISINGFLKKLNNQKKIANAPITLLVSKDKDGVLSLSNTDKNGNFSFDNLDFFGIQSGILQTRNTKGKNKSYTIQLMDFLYPKAMPFPNLFDQKKALIKKITYLPNDIAYSLDAPEVTVKTNRLLKVPKNGLVLTDDYGASDGKVIILGEAIKQHSILDVVRAKTPGFFILGTPASGIFLTKNGKKICEIDAGLFGASAKDVKAIFVGGGSCVSVIYDYKLKSNVGISKILLEGYEHPRDFYHPIHDNSHSNNEFDKRTTLYWNPKFSLSESNKQIIFYSSEIAGKFKVSIQGITPSGNIIQANSSFKVE